MLSGGKVQRAGTMGKRLIHPNVRMSWPALDACCEKNRGKFCPGFVASPLIALANYFGSALPLPTLVMRVSRTAMSDKMLRQIWAIAPPAFLLRATRRML